MKSTRKLAFIYAVALVLSISLAIQFASAQTMDDEAANAVVLNEEELDRVLAPIALYPDTLLTHVLIASTYPMDVIRAARWREKNNDLDAEEVLERVEVFAWDPSVKALTPFKDVLTQMSEDLDWLNFLGDSVIADEEWVLARIQVLRDQAYANGALDDNEYVDVEREDNVIVIESVRDRYVYVPFYDTRVVYGPWWHSRSPYYWHHPRNYYYRSGFYWSPSIHIASHFFFGGFHWHHGYVVVNNNFHRGYRNNYNYGHKRVYSRDYKRWTHNVKHRRARYNDRVVSYHTERRHGSTKVVRNREVNVKRYGEYQQAAPVQVAQHNRNVTRNAKVVRTRNNAAVNNPSVSRKVKVTRDVNVNRDLKVNRGVKENHQRVSVNKPRADNRVQVDRQVKRDVTRQKRDVVPRQSAAQVTKPTQQVTQPVRTQPTRTVTKQRSVDRSHSTTVQRSTKRQSPPKQVRSNKQSSRSSSRNVQRTK